MVLVFAVATFIACTTPSLANVTQRNGLGTPGITYSMHSGQEGQASLPVVSMYQQQDDDGYIPIVE
jgi:hypothetical protein